MSVPEDSEDSPLLGSSSSSLSKADPSKRWITIEPIIFLFGVSFGPFTLSIIPLYVEQAVAEARNFTYQEEDGVNGSSCIDRNISTNPYYKAKQEIAAETAQWVMISTVLIYFPAFFVSPICGAIGDRLGRKIQLLIPNIAFLCTLAATLVVLYLKLSFAAFVSLNIIIGSGGSYSFLLGACYAYIADITCGKTRLFRMAIIYALYVVGVGLAQIPIAYIYEMYGTTPCIWIFFVITLCNILYIITPGCLYESLLTRTTGSVNLILIKEALKHFVAFLTSDTNRMIHLLLQYLIYFITSVLHNSQAGTQIYVIYGLGPPFCWSPVTEALFTFSYLVAGTLGTLSAKLFSLCLDNFWIVQIAFLFGLFNYIVAGLASTTVVFILGGVIGGLRAMDVPTLNTMISTSVSPGEQGVALAVQSSVQNLANFISPLILNPIYSATVDTYPSLVFIVMAALVIGLIGLSCLWKYTMKQHVDHGSAD